MISEPASLPFGQSASVLNCPFLHPSKLAQLSLTLFIKLASCSTIEVDSFTAKVYEIYQKTREEGLAQVRTFDLWMNSQGQHAEPSVVCCTYASENLPKC